MNKISKRKLFEVLTILILGLIPLLWLKNNEIILGHDAGLTLFPIPHFLDRLSVWTLRFGFGHDQGYALAGFFIHGLEAFISYLGFNLQKVQQIVFIFWFTLPGLTMFYFSSKLEKKLGLKYFALPVSILYMINHFLLQGWLIAERTKFSLYAALPLIMSFLFDWGEGKRSNLKTALLLSLTTFFLNGAASIPLFGGLIVSIIVFVFFYLFQSFSKKRIVNLLKLSFYTFFISAFLNSYWLLPYGNFVLNSYSAAVTQAGGYAGILGWIDYISRNSSLINILRLQGIPEWYQNPTHPYSNIFLNNPLLIGISFLIPAAAFLCLLLVKEKEIRKKILFFAFLALFAMVFISGSHPPFGPIYMFLVQYVPGFIAFRTPFYKFSPALWFSYSILIGFTISYFLTSLSKKRVIIANILLVIFCGVVVFYTFPILNGNFFDYMKPERTIKVQVPQYIFDFGKWSDSKERINIRTLALPEPYMNIEVYNWGFWSLAPVTSLLTNAPIINESGYMSVDEIEMVRSLHAMMKKNDPGWEKFAKFLGIKSFLLRKDFDWSIKSSKTDPPSAYEAALKSSDVTLVKKFGQWEVYDFKDLGDVQNQVEVFPEMTYFSGKPRDLYFLFSMQTITNTKEPIYIPESDNKNEDELLKMTDSIYLKPSCVTCNLQRSFVNLTYYTPLLIRGSIFYPLVQLSNKKEEKQVLSLSKNQDDVIKYYLYETLKKNMSIDKAIIEKRDASIMIGLLEDYRDVLKKFNEILNKYVSSSTSIDNNFLIEAYDVLKTEKSVFISDSMRIESNNEYGQYQPELLNMDYDLINKILLIVGNNVWQSTNESYKRYILDVPLEKEYDILYRPNDPSYVVTKELNLSINGKKYQSQPSLFGKKWFSLGKFQLPKGDSKLEIEQQSVNIYDGPKEFSFSPTADKLCWAFDKKLTGTKDDVFRITFQHKRSAGSDNLSINFLFGNQTHNPFDRSGEVLRSTSDWENYIHDVTIGENNQNAGFLICGFPSADDNKVPSVITIGGLNVRKLDAPDVVVYGKNNNLPKKQINFSFDKKTLTDYNLNIDPENSNDKYLMVLNTSFNTNWFIDEIDEIEDKRFKVNGYANGWITSGKKKIKIEYNTQRYINLGFKITAFSFILSTTIYFILKFKKK